MNYFLKSVGLKKRQMSVNRSLNHEEITKKMNFCEKFSYWWFHNS